MDFSTFFSQYDQAFYTMAAYWIWNAAVQALPAPDPVAPSKVYVFAYNFAHGISANINLIRKESGTRTIVQNRLQGTGDGTMTEKKHAVEEAKKEIIKEKIAKLDDEITVSKLEG